jgi:hypothetical protein
MVWHPVVFSRMHRHSAFDCRYQKNRSIGEYRTELKKVFIHVVHDRAFIGVHPKK